MNNFNSDMMRGGIGEKAAKFWLSGVPFFNPERPILDICDADGIIKHRLPKAEMEMIPVSGYNKNNDYWLIDGQNGNRMKLEIKADFRAMTDDPYRRLHTGNIFVEVDPANVDNLEDVLKHRLCRGMSETETNWFNTAPEGHADWYAFYIPLINYDNDGNPRSETDMTVPARGGFQVSEAQITQFVNDQHIAKRSALITRYPFECFVCLRWEKLKEHLEEIVGIRFNDNAPSRRGKLSILLPLRKIVDAAHPRNSQTWEQDTIIVPCCQFAGNTPVCEDEDARDYTFYLPDGITDGNLIIEPISSSNCPSKVKEKWMQPFIDMFIRSNSTGILLGQTDGISAYKCKNDDGQQMEYQYFSSLLAVLENGYFSRKFYHFKK